MNAQALLAIVAGSMDKRQLQELTGTLYNASSATYTEIIAASELAEEDELSDLRAQWQELRDLAEYASRVADTMTPPAAPSPMFEVIGRMVYNESDAATESRRADVLERNERARRGLFGDLSS